MPGKQIDTAALAVVVEGELDVDQPTRSLEHLLPLSLDRRVVRVEQTTEITARHVQFDADRRADRCGRPRERLDRVRHQVPALEAREHGPCNLRQGRRIALAQASTMTERTESVADGLVTHC